MWSSDCIIFYCFAWSQCYQAILSCAIFDLAALQLPFGGGGVSERVLLDTFLCIDSWWSTHGEEAGGRAVNWLLFTDILCVFLSEYIQELPACKIILREIQHAKKCKWFHYTRPIKVDHNVHLKCSKPYIIIARVIDFFPLNLHFGCPFSLPFMKKNWSSTQWYSFSDSHPFQSLLTAGSWCNSDKTQ